MTGKQRNVDKKTVLKSSQSQSFEADCTDSLPGTRLIGRKVGKGSAKNGGNEDNTVKSTFDTGAIRSIQNRQTGGRGVKAVLNKYIHSSSIKSTEKEFKQFTTKSVQYHPHYDDLEELKHVYAEQSDQWLWLTLLNRNLLIYGIGDKKEFLDILKDQILKKEICLMKDGGCSSTSTGDKLAKDLLKDIRSKISESTQLKNPQSFFDCIIDVDLVSAATLLVSGNTSFASCFKY